MADEGESEAQGEVVPDSKAAQRLAMLLDITKTIGSELNIDILLPLIAVQTSLALEADRSTFFLVDEDTKEIWSKVAMGVTIGEIRQPVGVGLSGWVAQTGDKLNIPDVYEDPRFNREWDKKTGYRTKSMLVWPMYRRDGSVQGVYQVINKVSTPAFDKDDEEFLDALSNSVTIAVDNAALYTANQRLMESVFTTLAATVDAKDAQTGGHTERVLEYSMSLGRRLGLDPRRLRVLRMSALLHDYGKIAVSDSVLTKPAALTDEEYHQMQSHVAHTYNILSKIEFPRELRDVPRVAGEHHERNDGRGYPNKLTGDKLTFEGKILHVCDVFDALASKRYYKPAMPMAKILDIIGGGRGTEFDEQVVDAFVELLPDFKQIMKRFGMDQPEEAAPPAQPASKDGEDKATATGAKADVKADAPVDTPAGAKADSTAGSKGNSKESVTTDVKAAESRAGS